MAGIDLGEAMKIGAIGVAVGALGFYLISKTNIQLGAPAPAPAPVGGGAPVGQVPMQMPGATTMYASAKSYPAFGFDYGDDQWNNSEVWDHRDKTYFSDNILYNKLPYIPLTAEQDFNPQMLNFSQAYGKEDQDSPRPRHGTHALDREIADEAYPRKTPLPFTQF